MAYIVLTILGLLAVLLVKKTWKVKTQILFILLVLIGGVALYSFLDIFVLNAQEGIVKGPDDILSKIPWLEIGFYFTMLLGMVCKYLFDAIGDKNKRKIKIYKWQLIRPLFISPMVFVVVLNAIPVYTSNVLLFFYAYQNGFFWQSFIDSIYAEKRQKK